MDQKYNSKNCLECIHEDEYILEENEEFPLQSDSDYCAEYDPRSINDCDKELHSLYYRKSKCHELPEIPEKLSQTINQKLSKCFGLCKCNNNLRNGISLKKFQQPNLELLEKFRSKFIDKNHLNHMEHYCGHMENEKFLKNKSFQDYNTTTRRYSAGDGFCDIRKNFKKQTNNKKKSIESMMTDLNYEIEKNRKQLKEINEIDTKLKEYDNNPISYQLIKNQMLKPKGYQNTTTSGLGFKLNSNEKLISNQNLDFLNDCPLEKKIEYLKNSKEIINNLIDKEIDLLSNGQEEDNHNLNPQTGSTGNLQNKLQIENEDRRKIINESLNKVMAELKKIQELESGILTTVNDENDNDQEIDNEKLSHSE